MVPFRTCANTPSGAVRIFFTCGPGRHHRKNSVRSGAGLLDRLEYIDADLLCFLPCGFVDVILAHGITGAAHVLRHWPAHVAEPDPRDCGHKVSLHYIGLISLLPIAGLFGVPVTGVAEMLFANDTSAQGRESSAIVH
jgi:hypothetical protein